MEANAKSFTFLSSEDQVTIPFFQRPYVWKEENWNEPLDRPPQFTTKRAISLGSLILKQPSANKR